MQTHNLTPQQIADGLGRSLDTVYNWLTNQTSRPLYLDKALRGLAAQVTPLTPEQMSTLNVARLLGVPDGTARYWSTCQAWPLQARIAAAWVTRPPSAYQRTVMHHIDRAGTYYLSTRGTYRARGRHLPTLKAATVRRLIADGFAADRAGRITLTPHARDILYAHSNR